MIKKERRTREEMFDEFAIKSGEIGSKTKILKEKELMNEENLEHDLAGSFDSNMSALEYAEMLEEMYE